MKKSTLFLTLIGLGATLAQAAQVYTITLTSGERFTDCTVNYKSSDTTRFSGTDKNGKKVTKTVPHSTIINMREVIRETPQEEATPEPQAPAPQPEQPKAGEATAEAAPAPQETASSSEQQAEAPVVDGNIAQREGEDKAQNASVRLREKLARIDTEMGKISKPSRSLISQTTSVKNRITKQLADLDKRSLEVTDLQDKFNKAGAADFTFDKVSVEERDRYVRDGEAAYLAMKNDMKEKRGRRKVGGLDKFEIMRNRYQGIPEYKQAYEWYIKTLYALQKKWTRMHDKESTARKRLTGDKRKAMDKIDLRQYNELAEKLRADGDDIATVWFVPQPRNLKMLSICVNKVKDAIRRNEGQSLDKAVGTVPSLLSQYWEDMDKIRMSMITGDLEGAEEKIRDVGSFKILMGLKQDLLPHEYRDPIREQHNETQKEITRRLRDYKQLKSSLERSTAVLDRIISNAEAQIDSALAAVQKELDADVGENTMEVVQDTPAEGEAPAQQEAAPEAK